MRDLLSVPEFADARFAFTDVDRVNLRRAVQLCPKDMADNRLPARVHGTPNRRKALTNADYVINCTRIARMPGRPVCRRPGEWRGCACIGSGNWEILHPVLMLLRCPYCRKEFGPEPRATCPHCGRAMRLPDHLLSEERRERRTARQKARRTEEERVGQQTVLEALSSRQPAILIGMVVLLVVAGALLATRATVISLPATRPQRDRADVDLHALRAALERFRIDCGRYPTTEEGLRALVRDSDFIGWRGHYINRLRPDPWFRRYVYRCEGQTVVLLSLGPDGREGTADDIVPAPPDPDEVAGPNGRWRLQGGTSAPPVEAGP